MAELIKTYSFTQPTIKTVLASTGSTPTSVRPIIPGSSAPEIDAKQFPNRSPRFARPLETKRRK